MYQNIQIGKAGCYECYHVFDLPQNDAQQGGATFMKCPNCKWSHPRYEFKRHYTDPHYREWPYDDPTVPFDC